MGEYSGGMFNGLTFDKLIIVGVIAVFLIGPDKLPGYAAQLARLIQRFREFANGAKTKVKEEMGEDFSEEDWRKLDPRQYDPRRIIREALAEPLTPAVSAVPVSAASTARVSSATQNSPHPFNTPPSSPVAGGATPFDSEAT